MAKDVLAVPCSGVDVERLFTLTRDVITYRRDRLNPDTIEIIMMIKYNLNYDRSIGETEMLSSNNDELFANEIVLNTFDDLSFNLEDEKRLSQKIFIKIFFSYSNIDFCI